MSGRLAGTGSVRPLTLAELLQVEPLSRAEIGHHGSSDRAVAGVDLTETFVRLRRLPPHSLAVLHGEAAAGGWSLAAALQVAWERNAAGVVVPHTAMSASSRVLAERLGITLLISADDPVTTALTLAGQISAPASARALRMARCAQRLAEETTVRGILGVLNSELPGIPVALVDGPTVLAGQSAAAAAGPDTRLEVPVTAASGRVWAELVATIEDGTSGDAVIVESLLLLARQPLLAAWAQSRLAPADLMAEERAAFDRLRRLAAPAPLPVVSDRAEPVDAEQLWRSELGWKVTGSNRAVWLLPLDADTTTETGTLVRATWTRHLSDWPIARDDDGWVSWLTTPTDRPTAMRKALPEIVEVAGRLGLSVGVGRAHPGPVGVVRSASEARLAAYAAKSAGPGAVQWFEQVGVLAALAWLPTERIAQVADLVLPELTAAKDRDALVRTVLSVLDAGGSLSQAARALGVHRNTVLSRVARARELGLRPDDPEQRLALHVLCHALVARWN
jgi:hypothetical protein